MKCVATYSVLMCASGTYALSTSSGKEMNSRRRAFLTKTITSTIASTAMIALGAGVRHNYDCNCVSCMTMGVVEPANAFYERDTGDETSSAVTKALNAQARLTNARLEASGFPLDTKEEEEAKIREAFKSLSYEPVSTSSNKKIQSKGNRYANNKETSSFTRKQIP